MPHTDHNSRPSPLRVCLVALNAAPAILPQAAGPVGGIETRAWQFARGLARQAGVHVQFVVRLSRKPRSRTFEGVEVVPLIDRLYRIREATRMCVGRQQGFPWIKLHQWQPRLLWQLPLVAGERVLRGRHNDAWQPGPRLSSLSADVFCTFGVQSHSATVIASAHAAGRPAVLFLGSDGDLDEQYRAGSRYVSPYGDRGDDCWRMLQQADMILAQTPEQQLLLRERFGREATVISNPIDVEQWNANLRQKPQPRDSAELDRYVLWVGRADAVHKRPQLLIELARQCPDARFLLIMNPRDPALEQRLRREAPRNVRFVSWVPFERMPAVFARAAALVNTSVLEGFANTFLQAALSRVPIGALEVGESFMRDLGCGCYAGGDLNRLADYVRRVWSDGEDPAALDRARTRVIAQQGLAAKSAELAAALRHAADQGAPPEPQQSPGPQPTPGPQP